MLRSTAKAGDDVWLCGEAGFAAMGLSQWMAGIHESAFITHFVDVKPMLAHGVELRRIGVRCCIDISDGLFQDANHIAESSGVHIHIHAEALPGWLDLEQAAGEEQALQYAFCGGEDYALLFTAQAGMRSALERLAHRIGVCEKGSGVRARLNGQAVHIDAGGFDHFR
jgi:thiamine-monophosphate kinase